MLQIRSRALRRLCCLMLVLGLVGVAGSASGQTDFGCKEEADTCVVAKEETWTAVYGTLDLEDIAPQRGFRSSSKSAYGH